jgi:Competence protein CoiA-like family
MTAAAGPNRELVVVRRPGAYEDWRGRGGLTCLVCGRDVHVFRHQTGSLWLRHDRSADERTCARHATGPEGYEHQLLKHWIRDRLKQHGYDASCEQKGGQRTPDVTASRHDRALAVEVQLAALPFGEAQQRTADMQAEGYQVVWLTHHCDWVARLPAVGLHVERNESGYRATEIDGNYYSVKEGMLKPDEHGQLVGGRRRPALGTFIDFVALDGRLHWAQQEQDRYGWAQMDQWREHLQRQGARIATLEEQVERLATEVDARQRGLEMERGRTRALEQHLDEAASSLDAMRAELRKTWWGRRFLHRFSG